LGIAIAAGFVQSCSVSLTVAGIGIAFVAMSFRRTQNLANLEGYTQTRRILPLYNAKFGPALYLCKSWIYKLTYEVPARRPFTTTRLVASQFVFV
jgi:hypothetical protein